MIELIERILHALSSFAVFGILWVEIDDVYGVTRIRKMSRDRWRKFVRQFMRDSKRYFRKQRKVKHGETVFHESNE